MRVPDSDGAQTFVAQGALAGPVAHGIEVHRQVVKYRRRLIIGLEIVELAVPVNVAPLDALCWVL